MNDGEPVDYPAGIYGKTLDEAKDFGLLAVDPDFPPAGRAELLRLAGSFRWRSDSALDVYPPCFALIPLDDGGWLAVRFVDAGRDDAGRLHTLRVEAVALPPNRLAHAELRALLGPDGWPPFDPAAPPHPRVRPFTAAPAPPLPANDFVPPHEPPSAVLVKHAQAEYVGTRFARVWSLEPHGAWSVTRYDPPAAAAPPAAAVPAAVSPESDRIAPPAAASRPANAAAPPAPAERGSWRPPAWLVALAIGGWLGMRWGESRVADAEHRRQEAESKMEKQQAELTGLRRENEGLREKLGVLDRAHDSIRER